MHSENALLASLRSNHSFHMHAHLCHVMVKTSIILTAKNLALCSSHSLFYVMHHTPAYIQVSKSIWADAMCEWTVIYPVLTFSWSHFAFVFKVPWSATIISFFLCRLYLIIIIIMKSFTKFHTILSLPSRWWSSFFSSFTTTTGSAIRRWDLIYTFLLRERLPETRMCK